VIRGKAGTLRGDPYTAHDLDESKAHRGTPPTPTRKRLGAAAHAGSLSAGKRKGRVPVGVSRPGTPAAPAQHHRVWPSRTVPGGQAPMDGQGCARSTVRQ